jgi:ammonia channel protein AmtB
MSIIVQVFGGLTVLAFMWDLFGYSLVFSNDYGGIIGDFSNGLLINVGYVECTKFAPNIPAAAYALFMMMFASITPLLMTGGFAERLKFKTFIIFTILWEILVFYPVAHAIVRFILIGLGLSSITNIMFLNYSGEEVGSIRWVHWILPVASVRCGAQLFLCLLH